MVPNGWTIKNFAEITQIGNGQVNPKVEPYSSLFHIGPENVVSDTGQVIDIKTCKVLGKVRISRSFLPKLTR